MHNFLDLHFIFSSFYLVLWKFENIYKLFVVKEPRVCLFLCIHQQQFKREIETKFVLKSMVYLLYDPNFLSEVCNKKTENLVIVTMCKWNVLGQGSHVLYISSDCMFTLKIIDVEAIRKLASLFLSEQ